MRRFPTTDKPFRSAPWGKTRKGHIPMVVWDKIWGNSEDQRFGKVIQILQRLQRLQIATGPTSSRPDPEASDSFGLSKVATWEEMEMEQLDESWLVDSGRRILDSVVMSSLSSCVAMASCCARKSELRVQWHFEKSQFYFLSSQLWFLHLQQDWRRGSWWKLSLTKFATTPG